MCSVIEFVRFLNIVCSLPIPILINTFDELVCISTYRQVGPAIHGEAAFDKFGTSVSVSADGSTFVVGAIGNDGNGDESGHVRVFTYNSRSNSYSQIGLDVDGEAASDLFGSSVSLSADGTTFIVGAPFNDGNGSSESGHVRVFHFNPNTNRFAQVGLDINGESDNELSGSFVSISANGSRVVVGVPRNDSNGSNSGQIRVFDVDLNSKRFTRVGLDINGESSDNLFGTSVSISSDGTTIVVGAPFNDDNGILSGHVRVFKFDATSNSFKQIGPDIDGEAAFDNFGTAVSISADGSRFVVGAKSNADNGTDSGHVRVYNFDTNMKRYTQLGLDIDGEAAFDNFGSSVSISADGTTIVVGAPLNDGNGSNSGHVRVFQFDSSSNNFKQIGPDIDGESAGDLFGSSVSISADGSRFLVGAPSNNDNGNSNNSGHVRLFEYPLNSPKNCGVFGWNLFCPRSGKCGLFRRLLSLNGCV